MTNEELVAKAKALFRESWMYLSGYRWESLPPWQQEEWVEKARKAEVKG